MEVPIITLHRWNPPPSQRRFPVPQTLMQNYWGGCQPNRTTLHSSMLQCCTTLSLLLWRKWRINMAAVYLQVCYCFRYRLLWAFYSQGTLNVSIGKTQCISLLSCRSFTETVEDADEQTHNENGFCHPDTQPIHLPSKHPHENGRTILSHMWQGIQIVAAENGDLFVTSHTNLRVYVRSLSSEEGVSVQTLGPGCRLKVFDYAAFKFHLASKAAEQNGCRRDPLSVLQELLSHCVILTLGQPVERVHPLAMNYVTVVLFLRRMVKKMEQYYRIQLMESVENHFDWVMSSSPCIEVVEDHRVDAQDRHSPASSATQ